MPKRRSVGNSTFDGVDPDFLSSTRGRILTSAERLFADRGFARVSMPMIAQASGITAGAIYKHFDSKEDLFFEVVRHAVQSIPIPTEAATAFDAATDLPRIVATYTEERLELLRQLAVEIHSASAKHPRIRRLLRRSLAARIEQLRESIDSGQRCGSLDPSVDAGMLARTVLVFILGLMHMETLVPELVGDAAWRDFIQKRTATLLGVRE
jgi:AcrR family transcriptional regulator